MHTESDYEKCVQVLIYTYKRVVCVCLFVCWFVCLLFIGQTTFVHFAALPPSTPRAAKPSRRPRARGAGKRMHSESTRAHAVQPLNEKIAALMPFKNKSVRARACCRIRNCRDFQKKGKKKTNMPLPKFSLQFAFSWSVYFSNRTESYSAQIEFAGPHGIICNFTFSYLILSKTIGRKRLRT